MKKGIYIAFLLICNLGFSQGYQAKIVKTGNGSTTYTYTTNVTYKAFNGTTQVDIFTDSNIASSNEPPGTVYLNSTSPITSLTINFSRTYQEGGGAVSNCYVVETVNVTTGNCFTTFINSCDDFNVDVYNTQQILVAPTNNTICIDDPVTLQATNVCGSNTYNWQYSTNGSGPFIDLNLQTTGTNSTTVDMSTIIGTYNGSLFFRALVNGSYTNIITYSAIPCSPGFLSANTSQATCIYNQVTLTINFERPLFTGETIDIYIDKLLPNNTIMSYASATSQTYTGTSFTWPTDLQGPFSADILDGLEVGTYYLDYQTPGGILEPTPPAEIIITPLSSAVNFNVTETDVSCFNANNGSLEIMASGGIGNYQYKLNTNAWANFSTGNTHTINGLGPDIYNVQVRDGNQCEAQQ